MIELQETDNLEGEIKVLRDQIHQEGLRAREATYLWLFGVYGLFIGVKKSKKHIETVDAEYSKFFVPHIHSTLSHRLIKLCAREADVPRQTLHRWSVVLDIASRHEWSPDLFAKKLQRIGVEGVLRDYREPGETFQPAIDDADETVLVETAIESFGDLADNIEEDGNYVMLVQRKDERFKIKGLFKPTPALLKLLQRTQRARGPRSIGSKDAA